MDGRGLLRSRHLYEVARVTHARDERRKIDLFCFSAEVVAVVAFAAALPGCGFLEGTPTKGTSQHFVLRDMRLIATTSASFATFETCLGRFCSVVSTFGWR